MLMQTVRHSPELRGPCGKLNYEQLWDMRLLGDIGAGAAGLARPALPACTTTGGQGAP